MSGRDKFIDECMNGNIAIINDKRYATVIRHKTKGGKRVGTVFVVKTPGGKIYVGASKCRNGDKFEKHLGIYYARINAVPISISSVKRKRVTKELKQAVPLSMLGTVEEVIETISHRKSFVGK